MTEAEGITRADVHLLLALRPLPTWTLNRAFTTDPQGPGDPLGLELEAAMQYECSTVR